MFSEYVIKTSFSESTIVSEKPLTFARTFSMQNFEISDIVQGHKSSKINSSKYSGE